MPPDYSARLDAADYADALPKPLFTPLRHLRHTPDIFAIIPPIRCRRYFDAGWPARAFFAAASFHYFAATADISHYFAISHYCRRHCRHASFRFRRRHFAAILADSCHFFAITPFPLSDALRRAE
jgi:hypothetical protein